jgi:integrase
MAVRKRTWKTSKGEARTAWVVDYIDSQGVRRLKTFAKKKDADTYAATTHVELREGMHVADAATVTVAEAGELWITSADNRGLERGTVATYRQHLNLHIAPFIGAERLSKVTVPSVRAFEDRLRLEGRSSALMKKILVSLGMLLADAQERGLVIRNAVRERGRRKGAGADRHKRKLRVGVDIPSPDEIRTLFRVLERQRFAKWRPLIVTAALTGLRASELRGLRWQDVDFDREVLHVRQRADRFGKIGSPKSHAGHRAVPLTPTVVNILREWKHLCPQPIALSDLDELVDEIEAGLDVSAAPAPAPPKPDHLVFPNSKGNDQPLTNILRRGLWPACAAAGLTVQRVVEGKPVVDDDGKPVVEEKYSMHALRHFYASWCINRKTDGGLGLPPKLVQERLGHSTIALTMDTYGHLFPATGGSDELAAAERELFD